MRLLGQIVDAMDLSELYKTYFRLRKKQATPRQMLKVMLYAYMNSNYSTRKIERACIKLILKILIRLYSNKPKNGYTNRGAMEV